MKKHIPPAAQEIIDRLRREIDVIDSSIAGLITNRQALSLRIRNVKQFCNIPVIDRYREAQIVDTYERIAPGSAQVAAAVLRHSKVGSKK